MGFDLRYVIRFFGRHFFFFVFVFFLAILNKTYEWISVGDKQIRTFCLLPSLSSLDHYQPAILIIGYRVDKSGDNQMPSDNL